MEYERIEKVQKSILSPTNLRMKLMGPHNNKNREGSNNNSSRTSPVHLQVSDGTEFSKNRLLASKSDSYDGDNVAASIKPQEDKNLDYDRNTSSSSFEFHGGIGGERSNQNHVSREYSSRQMSSKWNDAEKWIMSRQNMLTNYVRTVSHPVLTQGYGGNFFIDQSTQSNDTTKDSSRNDTPAGPVTRSVCMRDMRTDMTPLPSQEPSRSVTPVGATTPLRSLTSSLLSTPRGGQQEESQDPSANTKRELSEEEIKVKTRREIVTLGVRLGKMNIAAWASKQEEERNENKVDAEDTQRIEFDKQANAWEEETKSKITQGCEIVRLIDFLERWYAVLNQCYYVVLDEADRMIDVGFEPQVAGVLDVMLSSNLKPENEEEEFGVDRLSRKYLRNPVVLTNGTAGKAKNLMTPHMFMMKESDKFFRLQKLLDELDDKTAIVFVNRMKIRETSRIPIVGDSDSNESQITWCMNKQEAIELLSCEADNMVGTEAVRQILYHIIGERVEYKKLVSGLKLGLEDPYRLAHKENESLRTVWRNVGLDTAASYFVRYVITVNVLREQNTKVETFKLGKVSAKKWKRSRSKMEERNLHAGYLTTPASKKQIVKNDDPEEKEDFMETDLEKPEDSTKTAEKPLAESKKEKAQKGSAKTAAKKRLDQSVHSYTKKKNSEGGSMDMHIAESSKSKKNNSRAMTLSTKESEQTLKSHPKWKQTAVKEVESNKSENGEELDGKRVNIRWPLDKKFYDGVIKSNNILNEMHLASYSDVDFEEHKKERWEIISDEEVSKISRIHGKFRDVVRSVYSDDQEHGMEKRKRRTCCLKKRETMVLYSCEVEFMVSMKALGRLKFKEMRGLFDIEDLSKMRFKLKGENVGLSLKEKET
ncbi:BnaC01g44880D [Brassica napus]|uniref:BnaC01g44870D protein n=1 Tax=Brassica napus TaxID=3708 RepID=A0A078JAI9_BRANA|nr:unnamed protein product [Brassica napus]CDY62472.1 BnaC01g44870D [Brassica napus]CDY62474.1 BnaC01g44880D [Brassica napus]